MAARNSVKGGKATARASTPARAPTPSRSKMEATRESYRAGLRAARGTYRDSTARAWKDRLELALSEMTGIGRTPIREAIQRLAREHLIVILPQRGLLIPEIDVTKQLRLLRTRREVERLICRSAAKIRDSGRKGGFRSTRRGVSGGFAQQR